MKKANALLGIIKEGTENMAGIKHPYNLFIHSYLLSLSESSQPIVRLHLEGQPKG